MSLHGQCPTCGAPIEFGMANSLVCVCESCNTIAGRGDGKLESYGEVADLVQTDSPLQVGMSGSVKDVSFVITGRAQLQHSAGGIWDEWYVAFHDGKRWGWLAEAQGRYYLTFPKKLPSEFAFDFDNTPLETEVTIPRNGKMKVVEIGQATAVSAEGEIPYEFQPGEVITYADLQGSKGRFATLDNSQTPPAFYLGGEFSLDKLGIADDAASREEQPRVVGSVGISCPQCGGALEQHCPESLRIVCPYCDSMLDVSSSDGSLKFLEKLGKQKIKPVIPLGTKGKLRGRDYTVIGFMRRKVRSHGVDYPWQEYLLYTPREGFHWLIHSESHWSLGKPISAGDVSIHGTKCSYHGDSFRIFSKSIPQVTHVLGEFYWEVSKGERTLSSDFVKPPFMISREETRAMTIGSASSMAASMTDSASSLQPAAAGERSPRRTPSVAKEVNYTLSEYLPTSEVQEAFGVKGLRRPQGVAPNQPYPHKGVYPLAFMFFAATLVLAIFFFAVGSRNVLFEKSFALTPTAVAAASAEAGPGGAATSANSLVFFPDEPINISARKNIQVTLDANVDNSWVYLAGDFFNEEKGDTYPLTAEAAYYHGVSGGESWSEGGRRKRRYVSSLPEGKYSMRLEFQWDRIKQPTTQAKVTIRQGVPRILNLILTCVALAILPLGIACHQAIFEGARWAESDFAED